jgi:hypothetical protein
VKRMQSDGNSLAEDTCYIKNHPQNDIDPSDVVEKSGVKAPDCPASSPPGVEVKKSLRLPEDSNILAEDPEKGVLPDSDGATGISQLDDEKDDFPEGGWKAWSVVAGAFTGCFASMSP